MIIAIDGSRAFIDSRTGTENYSYQIIKNLAKIDRVNSYLIYLRPGMSVTNQSENWPDNFHFININYHRLWTQIGLASQTFKQKADLLFVPAHTLPIIRKVGLKTVVTVHDLGSQYLPKTHQLKQRLYLSLMQKVQLKGATHLIAVSQATKNDLVKKIGINPKKVTVIYEGYDQQLFQQIRGDILINILKQYGIIKGKYFLFVGTVQPRKNLERLITAFSRLENKYKDIKLVIAGKKGWMSDAVYQLPGKLGIESGVNFLDYIPLEDLPALYSGAIAFTLPSLFEGFGLPVIEAQACGCAVLTSNVSSMPEIAGKGAVLVDPYSVDDIVKGMEIIKKQETRNKLIKTGFENAKRFSWEKAAVKTLEVFEGL